MVFIVVVAVVALIMASMILPTLFDGAVGAAVDGDVLARRMIYQQASAAAACAGQTCPAGTIDAAKVAEHSASFRSSATQFVSAAVRVDHPVRGSLLVTLTVLDPQPGVSNQPELTLALARAAREAGTMVGRYHRATGEVLVQGERVWVDQEATQPGEASCQVVAGTGRVCRHTTQLRVPVGSVGVFSRVADGAPVLVSDG